MSNIFIAPKIKIGFQNRTDCFTGKLAYVIYYDEKGKLRKEKSWESWRNKDIPIEEYENVPTEGFTLNRDVKRYSGDWFSSKRTLIRVHDPRGFEFEVTTENLIAILMHTDCLRRGLTGQFVYAWSGQELVLLPTNSDEYAQSVKYTTGLSKKIKSKELIVGASYRTKREGSVIYMGKLNWYDYPNPTSSQKETKIHVFIKEEELKHLENKNYKEMEFLKKDSVSFLSELNNETPITQFAELMDTFNSKVYANKIVEYEFVEFVPNLTIKSKENNYHYWDNNVVGQDRELFCKNTDNTYIKARVRTKNGYVKENEINKVYIGLYGKNPIDTRNSNDSSVKPLEFLAIKNGIGNREYEVLQPDLKQRVQTGRVSRSYYNHRYDPEHRIYSTIEDVLKENKFYYLQVKFANGETKIVKQFSETGYAYRYDKQAYSFDKDPHDYRY